MTCSHDPLEKILAPSISLKPRKPLTKGDLTISVTNSARETHFLSLDECHTFFVSRFLHPSSFTKTSMQLPTFSASAFSAAKRFADDVQKELQQCIKRYCLGDSRVDFENCRLCLTDDETLTAEKWTHLTGAPTPVMINIKVIHDEPQDDSDYASLDSSNISDDQYGSEGVPEISTTIFAGDSASRSKQQLDVEFKDINIKEVQLTVPPFLTWATEYAKAEGSLNEYQSDLEDESLMLALGKIEGRIERGSIMRWNKTLLEEGKEYQVAQIYSTTSQLSSNEFEESMAQLLFPSGGTPTNPVSAPTGNVHASPTPNTGTTSDARASLQGLSKESTIEALLAKFVHHATSIGDCFVPRQEIYKKLRQCTF